MLASTKRNGVGPRGTPKAPPPATAEQVREATPPAPSAEVVERAKRRQYTAEYKQRILREADAAMASGEAGALGALLRREGLYSSHLTSWRGQRDRGELAGLTPKKRGRKPSRNPMASEVERLQRQVARLEGDLEKARIVIAVQKKVAALLGNPIPDDPEET
jgi:transposase-like protein